MKKQNDRKAFLIKIIETKTILKHGEHFKLTNARYATKNRKNPENYVVIHFVKCNLTAEERKDMLINALSLLGIETQEGGIQKKFYIKIPNLEPRLLRVIPFDLPPDVRRAKEFDHYKHCLVVLTSLHESAKLFGFRNKDQRELQEGIANFNYFDPKECHRAFKYFRSIGISVKKRDERKCNLTFSLENTNLDSLRNNQMLVEQREPNMQMYLWLLLKLGKKALKVNRNIFELRGSELEMINIKSRLEKYDLKVEFFHRAMSTYEWKIEIPERKEKKKREKHISKPREKRNTTHQLSLNESALIDMASKIIRHILLIRGVAPQKGMVIKIKL